MADDYNLRAAKGQAFNLACHQAVADGKAENVKHIYSLYVKYYELGQLIQGASLDDIKKVIQE